MCWDQVYQFTLTVWKYLSEGKEFIIGSLLTCPRKNPAYFDDPNFSKGLPGCVMIVFVTLEYTIPKFD